MKSLFKSHPHFQCDMSSPLSPLCLTAFLEISSRAQNKTWRVFGHLPNVWFTPTTVYCFPAFDTTATSIQQSLQLALLNQDDGEGCHYHNRNHQVRRHPFKWVAQVSLLSHLTTRHQWDARLVTHTHSAVRRRLLSDCLSAPACTPCNKEEGGGLTPTGRSQEAKSRQVVRSHQGPKWPGSGPPRGRDDQRGRVGKWSSAGRDIGPPRAVVVWGVHWVWVLVCCRLTGYPWRCSTAQTLLPAKLCATAVP